MIIWIDKYGEVVSVAQGALAELAQEDNVTSFRVDALAVHGKNETLHFDPETRTFYTKEKVLPSKEEQEVAVNRAALKRSAERQIEAILAWFRANDWRVNKHTLGEWSDTDPRWLAYLEERRSKRAEYDAAKEALR